MSDKTIPAISVIIPMYNVEKYIGECLDSILNQTFQDFEVIVVDDCSTDKSCEIVEEYVKKFSKNGNERLQLVRSEVNSGGLVGIPRNIAIGISSGEYLLFMDSDDAIVENTLGDLYGLAKKFNVDVVHCEKYYRAPGDTAITDKNLLTEHSDEKVKPLKEPTLVTNNIEERVIDFGLIKFLGYPWNKLIRRDLLTQNNIYFPLLRCGDDHVFSFYVLCSAESILKIPTPYYVWRKTPGSVTNGKLSANKMVHRWTDSLFRGAKLIEDFMNQFEVLKNRPQLRYIVMNTILRLHTSGIYALAKQIPFYQMDLLTNNELKDIGDTTALSAFLYNRMNSLTAKSFQQQNIILEQKKQIQQLQVKLQQFQNSSQLTPEDIFNLN